MKKHILPLLLLLLFSTRSFSQEIIEMDINSINLNEIKVLKIFIPKGYNDEGNTDKYPLSVVLDSKDLFDSYVSISKLFSRRDKTPQHIIVGISHINKQKDYGYKFMNSYPTDNSMLVFKYINEEIIAFMKKKFRIASFKTIIGEELTANFINYFLLENTPAFDAYININPQYAPDVPSYVLANANNFTGRDFFYYIGNGNNSHVKERKMLEEMHSKIGGLENFFFNYKYEYFEQASETVSIPQSIASGIIFINSLYAPITPAEYKKNIEYLSPLAAIEYLQYKYENIEYLFGKKIPIRLKDFIAVESIILDKEEGIHLKTFADLVLENYPKEALGDYYTGKFHENNMEYREALLAYKRGYAKISRSSPKSAGFFTNIKRVNALIKAERTQTQTTPIQNFDEESYEEDEQNLDEDGNVIEDSTDENSEEGEQENEEETSNDGQ